MAERVTDLRDIRSRVVARLVGEPEPGVTLTDEPVVLVATDLAPADTAGLDPKLVLGLVTERGGPTSHTAIIARQLGIPCVVGATGVVAAAAGHTLLLDGAAGTIELDPDATEAAERVARDTEERAALAQWQGPGRTADGHPVKLLANVADAASAVAAAVGPVSGVGLFRTELSFLDRETEPTVEEQTAVYAGVLAPFVGEDRHVVVRTLDAGSDKPIAFATHPGEENPALGVRGLRLSFTDHGLLDRQLDAVAAAAQQSGATTWVMAPMVATVDEARDFAQSARARGLVPGVMVEVPSAALLADRILAEVDFLSIGTNDLTQYAMAADRLCTDLAHLTDPWQPAVLQLIAMTAAAGERAGKPVGVCGEAAADPLLACVLVGLGVTSLSMAVAAVRPVGARLATASLEQCTGNGERGARGCGSLRSTRRRARRACLTARVRRGRSPPSPGPGGPRRPGAPPGPSPRRARRGRGARRRGSRRPRSRSRRPRRPPRRPPWSGSWPTSPTVVAAGLGARLDGVLGDLALAQVVTSTRRAPVSLGGPQAANESSVTACGPRTGASPCEPPGKDSRTIFLNTLKSCLCSGPLL